MKKFIYLLTISLSFISCSGGGRGGTDDDPTSPNPTQKPVAVNDTATAIEDEELIISNLLSNDTVVNNARITSFDATTANGGSISDNRDGTYTYLPPTAFVGEDTFTYTLCDRASTPNCSTATVTITVEDQGTPQATNDDVNAIQNIEITFAELLDNDSLIDDATITEVNDDSSTGTVVLNQNKTITYTPQTDFSGTDTFTYTICDDDTPTATCVTATVTVTVLERTVFNIPSEISDYYNDLAITSDTSLNEQQLKEHTVDNHTTILSYGQRHQYLYNADADESNSDNVILMYSGESRYWEEYTSGNNPYQPQTFNTEHIYPQSLLGADNAVTDLHHLRACDGDVNSNRSNYPFIDGSGTYKLENNEWYPGDDWRGDVARMILYLNIRYGEDFNSVGGLALFLKWNAEDPVSTFEEQRNNVIEAAQGNRNPFIDNPYLATLIWGGTAAENKWE